MTDRVLLVHLDMDSPRTLARFWGVPQARVDLERFHDIALSRVMNLLTGLKIPASLFCIGEDLEESVPGREHLRRAFQNGHELANHTYTHPIGLTRLSNEAIEDELERCSRVVREISGESPVGFRAPSYDIDERVLNILEEKGFLYDSSAFWTSLKPIIKLHRRIFSKGQNSEGGFGKATSRVPRVPYFPSRAKWTSPGAPRKIMEIPLPRTEVFQLPFYSNFHLSVPAWFRDISIDSMRQSCVVYLLHLIEFVDFSDGIAPELSMHPNLRQPASEKIELIRGILNKLCKSHRPMKTLEFVQPEFSKS